MNPIEYIKNRCHEDGDCWIWNLGVTSNGTPTCHPPGEKQLSARRYLAMGMGLKIAGKLVTSKCCNKLCMAPDHVLCTDRKTLGHMTHAHSGYASQPARCKKISDSKRAKFAKLTLEQVEHLRHGPGMVKDRVEELGISRATASRIRAGIGWKDYTSPFAGLIR
jgi:hypothetical protein